MEQEMIQNSDFIGVQAIFYKGKLIYSGDELQKEKSFDDDANKDDIDDGR